MQNRTDLIQFVT